MEHAEEVGDGVGSWADVFGDGGDEVWVIGDGEAVGAPVRHNLSPFDKTTIAQNVGGLVCWKWK